MYKIIKMNDPNNLLNIKKDNEFSKTEVKKTDMIFFYFNLKDNFPKLINFSNPNFLNKDNNKTEVNNLNEEEEENKKQNMNLFEFFELLKRKRISNNEKEKNKNSNKKIRKLSNSSELNLNDSNESNDSIENLIFQFSSCKDETIKNDIITKLISSRKKLHKEKLENFYKSISLQLKESIEDVREWISFEEKFYKIDILNMNISRELSKYINVRQSEKFELNKVSSEDFLRIHFIGLIKVKILDYRNTLKSYK